MLKVLKWAGILLGGFVGLIVTAIVVMYFVGGAQLKEKYDIQPAAVPVPTDEAAIARGRHLATSIGGCTECHGTALEGKVMDDDPVFGRIAGSNLTSGKGGIGG